MKRLLLILMLAILFGCRKQVDKNIDDSFNTNMPSQECSNPVIMYGWGSADDTIFVEVCKRGADWNHPGCDDTAYHKNYYPTTSIKNVGFGGCPLDEE